MAHLRDIRQCCGYPGCTSRASEAVYTFRNELHSYVCSKHAGRQLAKVALLEDAYHAKQVAP